MGDGGWRTEWLAAWILVVVEGSRSWLEAGAVTRKPLLMVVVALAVVLVSGVWEVGHHVHPVTARVPGHCAMTQKHLRSLEERSVSAALGVWES